jgi:hypothetical protein
LKISRVMSALCQKQTLRTLLDVSETIVVFSSSGAAGGAKIPLVGSKNGIGVNDKLDPRLSAFVLSVSLIFSVVRKGCFTVPFHRARMETQGRY